MTWYYLMLSLFLISVVYTVFEFWRAYKNKVEYSDNILYHFNTNDKETMH